MGKFVITVFGLILLVGCASIPIPDQVYCPKCHHITNKNDKICKRDQAPLNGYKYWFWSRDRKQPRMAFPAETYLIKKDKKLIWFPDEVYLKD